MDTPKLGLRFWRVSELASSLIGIQVPLFGVVGSSPMPSAQLILKAISIAVPILDC